MKPLQEYGHFKFSWSKNICTLFLFQLGAATRLEGITPAAIVSLYNHIQFAEKKERITLRKQQDQKEEREQRLRARNASLSQQ